MRKTSLPHSSSASTTPEHTPETSRGEDATAIWPSSGVDSSRCAQHVPKSLFHRGEVETKPALK